MDLYLCLGFLACILVLGFFAGMESAFGSVSRLAIELRAQKNRFSGKLLSGYLENPARFIGSNLIMINLLLVGSGILITEAMRPFWENLFSGALDIPLIRLLVEIIVTAFILIFLSQLIPRAIFRARPAFFLESFIIPQSFILKIIYPICLFFISVSEWILKYLLNVRLVGKRQVFLKVTGDIQLRQAQQNSLDNEDLNAELLQNALSLPYVKIRQCMIPRNEIEALEITSTPQQARKIFGDTQLSKLIVYENSIDHILGYLHHLDMYKNPQSIASVIHPILAVPETMSAIDLMNKFTKGHKSMAWVVDEFGGTGGIVTMEDLLEEIFGEIKDEHDTEDLTEKQLGDREYIFSGRLEVDYLNEKYKFGLPETGSETLSGFIISHHETIPGLKERIIIQDFEFDILAVTETRIDTVRMKVL
jgi:putative hemolysin